MKSTKKNLIIYLSAMTLILMFLSLIASHIFPELYISSAFPYILVFYYITTLLIILILARSIQKRASYFVNSYMIITFVKLLLFSFVAMAYLFINKKDAIPFVVTFIVYYLFYAIFEVVALRQINERAK